MTHPLNMLAHDACPSIQYRLRRELLGTPATDPAMTELQHAILLDAGVREIMALQRADGWIGGRFHGEREPESAIRYLAEKGVEGTNPLIRAALAAIIDRGDRFDEGSLERVGRHLDAFRLGGSKMIRACVFAYAGHVGHDFVEEQIAESLSGFRSVLVLDGADALCRPHKNGHHVFNDGAIWPSIYHLRLLAFTHSWRNAEHSAMLAAALARMIAMSPLPNVKLLHKGQLIAPAQMDFMNDIAKDMDALSPREWMQWFQRMELIARLGVANEVPAIRAQIDRLGQYLDAHGGLFVRPLSHYYFMKWTPYIGLALEPDWRSERARVRDLTFRSLLILHYADRLSRPSADFR